jgi:hypothetical protein
MDFSASHISLSLSWGFPASWLVLCLVGRPCHGSICFSLYLSSHLVCCPYHRETCSCILYRMFASTVHRPLVLSGLRRFWSSGIWTSLTHTPSERPRYTGNCGETRCCSRIWLVGSPHPRTLFNKRRAEPSRRVS